MWLTGPVAPRHVGSSQTRARTRVPRISRQTLNHCATRDTGSLYILGNSHLLAILVQILYPSVGLSLHSLDSVFHRVEMSILMKSSLSWIMPLVLYPKNHHQTPRPSKFSPLLSSKSFTFRSVIHFELIFVNGIRSVSRIIFCISMYSTIC